jgi:NAD+ kinase
MINETPIKRVGVVVKPNQPDAIQTLCDLVVWLRERDIAMVGGRLVDHDRIEEKTGCPIETASADGLASTVDLMVVLGGDGTMISTARQMGDREVPVLGVNFGTLGYMAEFKIDEMFPALESILSGNYRLDRRVMFDVEHLRDETVITKLRVLNEVVINKAALSRIVEIDVQLNGLYVNSFRADGLIVATPTGSTAYNLSAGGPVVFPSMRAMILTPICPFSLTNRPIVLPDDAVMELRLKTAAEDVALTLDGQIGFQLKPEDCVRISKSASTFNLVQPTNRNYFDVLRDKLKWGR